MSYYIKVEHNDGNSHTAKTDKDPSKNSSETNLSIAASVLGIAVNLISLVSTGEVTPSD